MSLEPEIGTLERMLWITSLSKLSSAPHNSVSDGFQHPGCIDFHSSMLKVLQSTPYTPIFPTSDASAPVSCDSALTSSNDPVKLNQKSYIDRLKERHLLLSGLPDELCPPSRETSPGAETRIEALTLRMRKAHELHLPLELVLTCVGLKGGDWVGIPMSDDIHEERQYFLPATEEDWFEWEKNQMETRDKRRAEKKAAEYREMIAKWSEEVEEDPFLDYQEVSNLVQESGQLTTNTRGSAVLSEDHGKVPYIASRYFSPGGSRDELFLEHSEPLEEPVERASSPLPPAPALDPLPDFCDSFSIPDSPPLLPHDTKQTQPVPDDIEHSPSFAVKDRDASTPLKLNRISEPVLQLSSPISPPRCSRPLRGSQTSILPMSGKRPHENSQPVDIMNQTSTPRDVKRARTVIEPITPKSVWRPRSSQLSNTSQDPKRLPTLDALLAASSRKSFSRRGTPSIKRKVQRVVETGSPSPCHTPPSAVPDLSLSQPIYSMFRPQFQSTQNRALSLPPSPSQPMTSTQPISPQKAVNGTPSSVIGAYQSQFNVESRVDQVTAFLDADVWNVDA